MVFKTNTPNDNSSPNGIVTKFRRVRQVRLVDGSLFFSCKTHDRFGITCHHMLHVFVFVNESYPGDSHHDVSIVCHNTYYQYAYFGDKKEGTYVNLARLLEMACWKEVLGLAFTLTRIAFIYMVLLNLTKICCLNYTYNSVCETCRFLGIHIAGSQGDNTAGIPTTFT